MEVRRRQFLGALAAVTAPARPRYAHDVVTLGPDKIKLSRLAQGTGTEGFLKSSNQTRKLGLNGLAGLLR